MSLSDQLAAAKISPPPPPDAAALKHSFTARIPIRSILCLTDGGASLSDQRVRVGGWVQNGRKQGPGSFAFLEVKDGTCPANLQVIVDALVADVSSLVQTGTCVHLEGALKVPPEGTKQKVELKV